MQRPGVYWVAAVLTVLGLLIGGLPADAQTPTPTPTPTRPPPTATPTPHPLLNIQPLPPVQNTDPRFGAVQAIFAPQLAVNAGVRWERLLNIVR